VRAHAISRKSNATKQMPVRAERGHRACDLDGP